MDERSDYPSDGDSPTEEIPTSVNDSLASFYGTAKDVIDRYTHCVLCGANLHFTHFTDFAKNLTQETARCPECGVQLKRLIHRLQ